MGSTKKGAFERSRKLSTICSDSDVRCTHEHCWFIPLGCPSFFESTGILASRAEALSSSRNDSFVGEKSLRDELRASMQEATGICSRT